MTAYDYIKDDLAGYPFNAKYPPNYERYGGLYHGYKNNSEVTPNTHTIMGITATAIIWPMPIII